jgi:hypothetical protein
VQSCHLQGRSGTAICLGLKLKRSATGQSGLGPSGWWNHVWNLLIEMANV